MIWKKHVPEKLPVSPDLDWAAIAMQFELTGGFIKNAMLQALSFAVARKSATTEGEGDDSIEITFDDVEMACRLQARGNKTTSWDSDANKSNGISSLVAAPEVVEKLQEIVREQKAKKILTSQWGFDPTPCTVLFYGPFGCGQNETAEALASEIGTPIRVVNANDLLRVRPGNLNSAASGIKNQNQVASFFMDAKNSNNTIIVEGAEALIYASASDDERAQGIKSTLSGGNGGISGGTGELSVLLFHLARFPGVVILLVTSGTTGDTQTDMTDVHLPTSLTRVVKHTVCLAPPGPDIREELWRTSVPKDAPLSKDIDWAALASSHDSFVGQNIKNSLFYAASTAALRPNPDERIITMADLEAAAAAEEKKAGSASVQRPKLSMYM